MARGIIYIMKTAVDGLIKIGKTGLENFERRMYDLEHDGYRNVTALKRVFAIEVVDYDEKESLLHTIFAKSQVGETELFALDINIAIQLLSSFDGNVIYPKQEKKEEIFEEATEKTLTQLIPDGEYVFERKKRDEEKPIQATAIISNGSWTIKRGSKLSITTGKGISKKALAIRATLNIDKNGVLLDDFELGQCTPTLSAVVVQGGSIDGWTSWTNKRNKKTIDFYRKQETTRE